VTVLLGTPNIDDVRTTLTQAVRFNSKVQIYPTTARRTEDPTKAGASWTKAADGSISRYGKEKLKVHFCFVPHDVGSLPNIQLKMKNAAFDEHCSY
jgi:hypothetical protein